MKNIISVFIKNNNWQKKLFGGSVRSILQNRGLAEFAAISPDIAREISKKLEAGLFIYGFIQQEGNKIRSGAQLIDTGAEEVLRSFDIQGPYVEGILFDLTDSIQAVFTKISP